MINLDATDHKLIGLLQKDSRQSSETLATQLNVSSPTVRRRIRSLLANGIINILAIVNPYKIGLSLATLIALEIDFKKLDSVREELHKISCIQWLVTTTGRFDIIFFARFGSTEELSLFTQKELRKIKGIKNSETFVCLQLDRMRYLFDFRGNDVPP